ncbi:Cobalt-zinc-cadmium resistance protein CzcB [compost metagenome]
MVIETEALQTDDGHTQVFVAVPGGFAARTVKTGRTDGQRIEVTDGLPAGTRYVAANSFVLKAEQGKAGAEHAH